MRILTAVMTQTTPPLSKSAIAGRMQEAKIGRLPLATRARLPIYFCSRVLFSASTDAASIRRYGHCSVFSKFVLCGQYTVASTTRPLRDMYTRDADDLFCAKRSIRRLSHRKRRWERCGRGYFSLTAKKFRDAACSFCRYFCRGEYYRVRRAHFTSNIDVANTVRTYTNTYRHTPHRTPFLIIVWK